MTFAYIKDFLRLSGILFFTYKSQLSKYSLYVSLEKISLLKCPLKTIDLPMPSSSKYDNKELQCLDFQAT